MKFSIVTACRNPGDLLLETSRSILEQRAVSTGRVELQYIIIDAASTDGTDAYLASMADDPRVTVISEPDDGFYDGLTKGLDLVDGDVHAYLNAGDLYHPHAFDVVADTLPFSDGWITGMGVIYNERGDVIRVRLPYRYRATWLRSGLYDGRLLPCLQQESTFWSASLTEKVDLEMLRRFQLAGDAYLWSVFAEFCEPTIVEAHLGGFRLHGSHLSDRRSAYRGELRSLGHRRMPGLPLAMADRVIFYAPVGLKCELNRSIVRWRGGNWGTGSRLQRTPRRRIHAASL